MPEGSSRDRILFVQWMGDYREAYNRMQSGGPETYYAQRYSMDKVAELVGRSEQTGVLCCRGDQAHDEVLTNGVRSMNAGLPADYASLEPVIRAIETFRPTRMILATPQLPLLEWCLSHQVDVMAQFADSFAFSSPGTSTVRRWVKFLKHLLYTRRLARRLNDHRIRCVANHNVPASMNMVRIGVDARKVIPWDWPPMIRPDMYPPKKAPEGDEPWQLVYVGSVIETKGIGDAIEAVADLRGRGRDARLCVLGGGDLDRFARLARERGVDDRVVFEGMQGNARVIERMISGHLLLVPSHHAYAEGMPFVIQEAFSTRTPMVCSDHPMFRDRVIGPAAVGVPERRPDALAAAIERILTDPGRYEAMSVATQAAWQELQAPVRWGELFQHWLNRSPENDRWLAEHSIASGAYDRPGPGRSLAGDRLPLATSSPTDEREPIAAPASSQAPRP